MSFYKRYELRRLVADGEVKTFTAVENETGRDVLLHMFNPPGLPLLAEFKTRFLLADGRSLPPAIEVGEFAGSQYAVTSTIDSFQSLRQWMQQQGEPLPAMGPETAAAPAPATPPDPFGAGDAGDFTRAFGSAPPKPVPAAPLVNDDPGDFTRAFGSVVPKAAPGPKAAPPLNDDPGDFTRAFGSSGPRLAPPPSSPSPPPTPRQPSAPAGGADEFARLFGGSDAPPSASPTAQMPRPTPAQPIWPAPPPPAPPQPSAPAGGADEFARLFGGPDAPPPAPAQPAWSAPPSPAPSSPTAQMPRPTAAQPAWPAPPPPAAPPQAPPRPGASLPAMPEHNAADTGEFTKLFGSGPVGQSIDIAEEQAKAARTAPQESRPFQQAGEFTRTFGPELGGPQSAPPRDATFSLNTSASSLFGSPEDLARQANAALSHTDHAENTGDYERIFGGSSTAEAPPSALKRAPTAPAARLGPSPLVIVLITLGAAILVAGLIYLAVLLGNKP